MTVHCQTCGRRFPRDPAREVPCPECGADVGSPCRRPSEHRCKLHLSRDRLALVVTDYGPCPEGDGESSGEAARKLLDDDLSLASALEKLDYSREDLVEIAADAPTSGGRAAVERDAGQAALDRFE